MYSESEREAMLFDAVRCELTRQTQKHGLNRHGQTVDEHVDNEINCRMTNVDLLRAISAALPDVVQRLNSPAQ